MTYGGHMPAFFIDWNASRNDDTVGTTLLAVDSPAQAQIFPPKIGDLVWAVDEDETRWAAFVVDRKGLWLNLWVVPGSGSYVRFERAGGVS